MENAKPVAKSLHTLKVIQQVARLHRQLNKTADSESVDLAMATLGLDGRPDPYGLRDKALASLNR